MYSSAMDVPVTELRAHLSEWLDRVRGGEEVVVTDHGVPVVRMLGLTATATLQRLAGEGVIGRDSSARRPIASGRPRPQPTQSVSGIISDERG
jgi:prevent-host-death family protein